MNSDLMQWIKKNNFNLPPEASDDGEIYRFSLQEDAKNKNGWFWAVKGYTQKGEEYAVAVVGDWADDREESRYRFRTQGRFTRADTEQIKKETKEALERTLKMKEAFQKEVAIQAAERFGAGRPGSHPYLERKRIQGSLGTKVITEGFSKKLLVPMYDASGVLWGVQSIDDQGRKIYMKGQRVKGCFHTIPDGASLVSGDDPIYLCEGFATGAAVFEATQGPVVVAFDAGNLEAVAKALRQDAPSRPIVICGDEDKWKRTAEGEPINPGREKALAAAKKCMGSVVFPTFANEDGKPTDFNDLLCREGVEKVKEQIFAVKPVVSHVYCLGHADGNYYYTSSSNPSIVRMRAHSSSELLDLMPVEHWESAFPAANGAPNWTKIGSDLMLQCRARGPFAHENVRGRGIWIDAGRTVIHLGDRLNVDGQEIPLHGLIQSSQYVYCLGKRLRSIHPQPLSLEECLPVKRLIELTRFNRKESRFFGGGWIICALLCGILEWRPHIWPTGVKGAGKTKFVNLLIRLLGDLHEYVGGGSSEAGIRQMLKSDALAVLFDEFESDSENAFSRTLGNLDFFRQASSNSGKVVKGTTHGEAMAFNVHSCGCVSSIKTMLTNPADQSRFTVLEIVPVPPGDGGRSWDLVERELEKLTPEYVDRFLARVIQLKDVFLENEAKYRRAFSKITTARFAQQHGPLLAGYQILISDTAVSQEAADIQVSAIWAMMEDVAAEPSDSENCLEYLLSCVIQIREGGSFDSVSIAQAVTLSMRETNTRYERELQLYGIRPLPENKLFVVSKNNQQLSRLFKGTPWDHEKWGEALQRLPGAKSNQSRIQERPDSPKEKRNGTIIRTVYRESENERYGHRDARYPHLV